jgi:uncharacterized CHY-type Zn-finger protein
MENYKGKGLTPSQYEIFIENEKKFDGDFFSYIKTLVTPREIEFAQLRRKYQSSFIDKGDFKATFTHKFSNPDEFNENLSKSIKKSGLIDLYIEIQESFQETGFEIKVLSEINEEFKESLEFEVKNISINLKSPFQTMKYLDSHIQTISADAVDNIKASKEIEKKIQLEKLLKISKAAKQKIKIDDKNTLETQPESTIKDKIAEKTTAPILVPEEITEEPEEPQESHKSPEVLHRNISVCKKFLKICGKQITFRNLGSASLTQISMEIICERCNSRKLCNSSLTTQGPSSNDVFVESFICECTLPISFEVTPSIIFLKSGKKIATCKFSGCNPLDLIKMDFKFSCSDCGEYSYLYNSSCYINYNISCQECFAKGNFQLDGVDFLDNSKKEEEEEEKDLKKNNFIGKPLPKNGICKHFKNSYRWFKFPCCQRLFPCMVCHDDNTDHPSLKAEIYICGFCGSLEKIGSKNICKSCKSSINGQDGDKKFWEGGKGCRNVEKMSKNDRRKYKIKK